MNENPKNVFFENISIERLVPQQAQELRENSWLQKEAAVH